MRVSVRAAVQFLRTQQQAEGHWPEAPGYPGGTTALATLALLGAGIDPADPAMQRAIEAVRGTPRDRTYVVALKIQALAAADARRYQKEIQQAADWLAAAQLDSGTWTYTKQPGGQGTGDFSNSQFALLGLHDASRAGAKVNDAVWERAAAAWRAGQFADGGWGYVPLGAVGPSDRSRLDSYGSMTAAGIASLHILGNTALVGREKGFTAPGEAPGCGRYAQYQPITRGLQWLARHFTVQRNPEHGNWYFYYMYGLERVGILAGMRHIGPHDWYREGAARLVRLQRADGSWQEHNAVIDTSFALLFLVKGHRPVLIAKLQWSDDSRWNLDRNDLAHLIAFIGEKLGEPVSWEVTPLDAPVEDWLIAPILYFNGHEFPAFDDDQLARLVRYVEQGGTLLAEACCSRAEFRAGFTAFARRAFPEYELVRLSPDHPVFNAPYALDGAAIELHGINLGCRTSVIFSPHDLSCLWEQGDVPELSERAFQLGTNIAAYPTGQDPLPDKLDAARLVRRVLSDTDAPPPRGAVYIAQLMHNGDWRPNPKAIPNLADHLRRSVGADVVGRSKPLRATDPGLARHPIVYMTGHFSFELSPGETDALRLHLQRGGFLLATACCGRPAFDASFRELARELFPDHPLVPLPADHPILAGNPGVPLADVTYRPSTLAARPGLTGPRLEGVTLDGRAVLVYSPFSLDCGLDGHACHACLGLEPADARRVAGNAVAYALSY